MHRRYRYLSLLYEFVGILLIFGTFFLPMRCQFHCSKHAINSNFMQNMPSKCLDCKFSVVD